MRGGKQLTENIEGKWKSLYYMQHTCQDRRGEKSGVTPGKTNFWRRLTVNVKIRPNMSTWVHSVLWCAADSPAQSSITNYNKRVHTNKCVILLKSQILSYQVCVICGRLGYLIQQLWYVRQTRRCFCPVIYSLPVETNRLPRRAAFSPGVFSARLPTEFRRRAKVDQIGKINLN